MAKTKKQPELQKYNVSCTHQKAAAREQPTMWISKERQVTHSGLWRSSSCRRKERIPPDFAGIVRGLG
jgi:hypothetical protein